MSNDFVQMHVTSRRFKLSRLQTAIETLSKDSLEAILSAAHAKAVELAPLRTDLNYPNGRPRPEEVAAPGLLKNSICYAVGDGELQEVNSYGGQYQVSDEYKQKNKFGAHKQAGSVVGYLGTFVKHSDYVNWTGYYPEAKHRVTADYSDTTGSGKSFTFSYTKWEYDEYPILSSTADYPYGVHIELEVAPFIRPAIYSVLDSGEFRNVTANVFKRDLPLLLDAGTIEYKRVL